MKKLNLLLIIFFLHLLYSNAKPLIEWQRCLGGSGDESTYSDHFCDIEPTLDGGFIFVGYSKSIDGDVSLNFGSSDYWVVKLNYSGKIEWQKTLGGDELDCAYSVKETNEGDFIVAGHSASNDHMVLGNHGNFDFWIIKLNRYGETLWKKCYGGSETDYAYSIQLTGDGGYIVAGYSKSTDGDITDSKGNMDCWVMKINNNGELQWQKSYGGLWDDGVYSIETTNDGGYIIAGYTSSDNGDVKGNHGKEDYWIVKINGKGDIQWQKCFGGTKKDIAYSAQQTTDGGYIVAGSTLSDDGDVTGNHGNYDYWLLKLNSGGSIQWQKCFGGSKNDTPFSVHQTKEGGFIVTGFSSSDDGDLIENKGNSDSWIIKLNVQGNIEWQRALGGSGNESAFSIRETDNSGYIIAGATTSIDGDVRGYHGNSNYWIVKISREDLPDYPDNVIFINDLESNVGVEDFHIPIKCSKLSGNHYYRNISFTAKISLNASTFLPKSVINGKITKNHIDNHNLLYLSIHCDSVSISGENSVLTEIIGTVLLGDSITSLDIVDFQWDNIYIQIDTMLNGSLKTHACAFPIRGVRLFNPASLNISPNPSNDHIVIEAESDETGLHLLSIYNMTGIKVESKSWMNTNNSINEFRINLRNYPAGIYYIVLTTPWNILNSKFIKSGK